MSKGKKRFLVAGTSLLMVGAIVAGTMFHDSTEIAASTKVLKGMEDYQAGQVKILEIVPTDDKWDSVTWDNNRESVKNVEINKNAEIGYFMPRGKKDGMGTPAAGLGDNNTPSDITLVSNGGVHGQYGAGRQYGFETDTYKETVMNLYNYGLIPDEDKGMDPGATRPSGIGDYPIYASSAFIGKARSDQANLTIDLGSRLVKGYYMPGAGDYNLDTQNFVFWKPAADHSYQIYTVSDNSYVHTVEVSANDLKDPPTPVVVDTSSYTLPKEAVSGTPIITPAATSGTGNVIFVPGNAAVQYYGYDNTGLFGNLWCHNGGNLHCRNSNWWDEYVLGDAQTQERKDNTYTVMAANDANLTADIIKNYDLIYISGTAAKYAAANSDITEAVMLEIYNQEINNHKAVMMDAAIYDPALKKPEFISKLAKLLWQVDQSNIYDNDKLVETATSYTHTWFDLEFDPADSKKITAHKLKASAWNDAEFTTLLDDKMISLATGNGNFVTGNTYVYDHARSNFVSSLSKVDAHDIFANGDFISAYTDSVVSQGLSSVQAYIDNYNKTALSDLMPTIITPAVCIQYILVSDGSPLKNLKSSLSVLEIEPVPAYLYNTGRGKDDYYALKNGHDSGSAKETAVYDNRERFIKDYLADFYKDRMEYVEFTSMTVAEFNSRSEDLVETYDIIYIGDETVRDGSFLYYTDGKARNTWKWNETKKEYEQATETNISNFTDNANMCGNIYYNVGDKVTTFAYSTWGHGLNGWLDTDPWENWPWPNYTTWNTIVRYDSRDITKNKLAKLEEYVQSGALVLVAEDLMGTVTNRVGTENRTVKNTVVNPTKRGTNVDNDDKWGRIDNCSNLYEFLQFGLGKSYSYTERDYIGESTDDTIKKNVVAVSDIKQDLVKKEDLAGYVSSFKLELNLINTPTEYSYEVHNRGYITKEYALETEDNNGKRYLEYEFSIVADAELAQQDSFHVNLYIDVNKDGKFSKSTEAVKDVSVINAATGKEAERYEDNAYKLYADNKYILRRNIADAYTGLISWKLDIQSDRLTYLHDSKIGYTLVQHKADNISASDKKQIKILQITQTGTHKVDIRDENNQKIGEKEVANSTLDMEGALYKYRMDIGNYKANNTDVWGMYLEELLDYELYIRTLTITEFENVYRQYRLDGGKEEDFFDTFYVQYTGIDDNGKETNLNPVECQTTHTTSGTNDKDPVTVVASELRKEGYTDKQGVDMIVIGFGDNIAAFSNAEALNVVKKFIDAGNPVLTTHDFLLFRREDSLQSRTMRDVFGNDKYGVTTNIDTTKTTYPYVNAWNFAMDNSQSTLGKNYLHTGVSYTYGGNTEAVTTIEKGGKEVAYVPNSTRKTTASETHGFTNFQIDRVRRPSVDQHSWINAEPVVQGAINNGVEHPDNANSGAFGEYYITKINEGQITTYPYYLPTTYKTTATHSQYFTLDLTSDKDDDGESDVVVWYALDSAVYWWNRRLYNDEVGGSLDPANGFYIYNDGNITYTGAGHAELSEAPKEEVQLFINTLIAAYSSGISPSSAGFYETPYYDAPPINSVIVPYDENVTRKTDASGKVISDSSIVKKSNAANADYKYKFVDPNNEPSVNGALDGTMVYYRIEDENFVRGNKNVLVNYYVVVQEKDIETDANGKETYKFPNIGKMDVEDLVISNVTYKVVDLTKKIKTYPVKGNYTLGNELTEYREAIGDEPAALRGVTPGYTYGIYLPMSILKDSAKFDLILRARTEIESVSTSGEIVVKSAKDPAYQILSVIKADLLDLD